MKNSPISQMSQDFRMYRYEARAGLEIRKACEMCEMCEMCKPGRNRFWRNIEQLRHIHAIDECAYRRLNRHVTTQIVLTAEGVRQCAV